DTVINKFDNALHYVDAQVGAFVDYLKAQGLYENSLIVVASDHGEAFYERGYPTHGTGLFEDQMRTAALFKFPGSGKTGVREDPVSLIDINPTILEALGMPNHPNFQGRPVARRERGAPIYLVSHGVIKAHGIVDYPWKYISSARDGEWLLNLAEDPTEWTDFSSGHPGIFARLKEQLQLYQMRQLYYYTVLPQEERDRLYPPRH
uniref:sulfatase family protein n=1 Tax=Pontiella sp. TaxID=2837462 RepID=UPI0035615939